MTELKYNFFISALNVHFESQPLPHFVSWYMHHTPNWFLKLGTVFTLIVEQLMPFLFFFPLRSVRQMGFFFQVFLQLMIIFTGNYNFFNLLTIVLCFSLLDDRFFYPSKKSNFLNFTFILIFKMKIDFIGGGREEGKGGGERRERVKGRKRKSDDVGLEWGWGVRFIYKSI